MESRKKKRRGSIAKNREKLLQLKPAKKSTPTGPPKRTQTALQTSLSHLGSSLTLLSVVACCALFIIGVSREFKDPAHRDDPAWLHCLLTSLALAVSAIPECLPLAVTICLAMGGTRLTKAKILVRQLPAIENIGMVTVVCSDKVNTHTIHAQIYSVYFFFFFFATHSGTRTHFFLPLFLHVCVRLERSHRVR